jgi:hypothetical protein
LQEKAAGQPQEQMGLPGMLQQAQQANGQPQQDQVQQPGQPMPEQPAPQQQMPQQQAMAPQGQPQQLNMGGVAGLPSNMFKRFDAGGIVAFAEGDLVPGEDQSAAETARLQRAEAEATARELQAARESAPAPYIPPEALEGIQVIKQAPFVEELTKSVNDMDANIEVTTPQQEMERKQALYKQFGIRPPGEDELARVAASKEAYEKDKKERAFYQGMKALGAAARPNVYGRYMPGTIGETVANFGLSNLEVDRNFREANEKSEVAAKEAKRLFEMGDLNSAIQKSDESKQFKREANKAKVTAFGQAASSGINALGTYMSNAENKRYHDIYENIQNKDLKLKAQQIAQTAQSNIPEMFRAIDQFSKRYPDMASKMAPENLLLLGAEMSKVNKGFDERAQSIYENQRIKVQEDRQKAMSAPDVKLLQMDVDNLTKSGKDPQKLQKAKDSLKDKIEKIEAAHPMPTPPRGGLETLLNPKAPAPTAAPGEPKTKYRMTKDGKLESTSP